MPLTSADREVLVAKAWEAEGLSAVAGDPVDDHFVPFFYLKAWAGPDRKVIRDHRPHSVVMAAPRAPKVTGQNRTFIHCSVFHRSVRRFWTRNFFHPIDPAAAAAHRTLLGYGLNTLVGDGRTD
jgi:hypothetical protein